MLSSKDDQVKNCGRFKSSSHKSSSLSRYPRNYFPTTTGTASRARRGPVSTKRRGQQARRAGMSSHCNPCTPSQAKAILPSPLIQEGSSGPSTELFIWIPIQSQILRSVCTPEPHPHPDSVSTVCQLMIDSVAFCPCKRLDCCTVPAGTASPGLSPTTLLSRLTTRPFLWPGSRECAGARAPVPCSAKPSIEIRTTSSKVPDPRYEQKKRSLP